MHQFPTCCDGSRFMSWGWDLAYCLGIREGSIVLYYSHLSLYLYFNFTDIISMIGKTAKIIWTASSEFGTSHMRAAKVQASLRIRAVSPEPPLLAHISSESRGTFRQKARSLAPLNGWACAVKICHDGMFEDTNWLDGAHIVTSLMESQNLLTVFVSFIIFIPQNSFTPKSRLAKNYCALTRYCKLCKKKLLESMKACTVKIPDWIS